MTFFCKFNVFIFFLFFSGAQAVSTSTNATYNGTVWSGSVIGTPGPSQNNTFNAIGGQPALAVQGPGSGHFINAEIQYSTNIFNGDFISEGEDTQSSLDHSTNTITGSFTATNHSTVYVSNSNTTIGGGIVVGNGGSAVLSESNNVITGGAVVEEGSADFSNFLSSSVSNSIDTVTVRDNATVDFKNKSSGAITNTITSITQTGSDSWVDLSNKGSGSATNTVTTVNLSNGKMYVGGNNCTTQITTMNWDGGEVDVVDKNGSFGNTHINTLNVTGPVMLGLYGDIPRSGGHGTTPGYLVSPPSGTFTLFTVDAFTGDASNISIVNNAPFVEVISANGGSNAVSVSADGKVTVNLVPVATTSDSTTISAVTGAVDATFINAIQAMEIADSSGGGFAPTSAITARNIAYMKRTFRENSKNSFEAVVMALSALDSPIVKSKGDYRVCLAPYAVRIRNSGIASASGFTEKTFGFILGGSHYFKSLNTNLMFLMGMGASKTQQDVAAASKTNGKSLILGMVATKEIWNKTVDIISSLYGIITKNRQARQGNPSPTQSYVALSRYNTKSLSWQNEAGYIVKFQDGYSIRPKIGLQFLGTYRSAFSEQDAGVFAQKYKNRYQYSGEIFTGFGFRRKWNSNRYEGKVTLSYDIGRLSGGRKSSVMVYADSAPSGVSFSQTKPGLTVQYISLNGSILDKENNWKIAPGASYSFQQGQRSLAGTLKFEYRW